MEDASTTGPLYQVILETLEGVRTIQCGGRDYVWDAARRSGVLLPSICHQGRCLTCAGRLISGTVDQADADTYFSEDSAAGFVLLCRAKPLSDLHILTHQQWAMREHRKAFGLPAPYS
jgi:ferredoxin